MRRMLMVLAAAVVLAGCGETTSEVCATGFVKEVNVIHPGDLYGYVYLDTIPAICAPEQDKACVCMD